MQIAILNYLIRCLYNQRGFWNYVIRSILLQMWVGQDSYWGCLYYNGKMLPCLTRFPRIFKLLIKYFINLLTQVTGYDVK